VYRILIRPNIPSPVISLPPIFLAAFVVLVWLSAGPVALVHAQAEQGKQFDLQKVVERVDRGRSKIHPVMPWWNQYVKKSQRKTAEAVNVDITGLLVLAIHRSNQIQIASTEPKIRKAFVEEMDAGFDWAHYVDGNWNDTSEPTGSSLTAGAGITQFNDHQFSAESGVRRQNRKGGQFTLAQRFGWQDNNSNFLTPPNQANSRLTLSYTQPLLRGRGEAYNSSVVVLAKIDALIADEQFRGELEDHLLEIVRAYWALFLERTTLAQQARMFLKTEEIVETIEARMQFDAERTQYISAKAALESRKANLLQTQLNVINSESALRSLINAWELGEGNETELVPVDTPSILTLKIDLADQIQKAVVNRSESHVASQRVRQAMTRLGVARNEIMPRLDLVTQGYLSGLQGEADFARSFADQFSAGSPSYSLGINYELPIGNRAAQSRQTQRQLELERIGREYRQTVQLLQMEVESAVRALYTARREINVRSQALQAAEAEAITLRKRWDGVLGRGQNAGLNLEALLRAQERVAEFEQQYVTALITYNLAAVELRKANGTLLMSEPLIRGEVAPWRANPSVASNRHSNVSQEPTFSVLADSPDHVVPPYESSPDPSRAQVARTERQYLAASPIPPASRRRSQEEGDFAQEFPRRPAEPRYAQPRHAETRYTEPSHAAPRYTESRRAEPSPAEPRNVQPRYAELPRNFRVQQHDPVRQLLSFPSLSLPNTMPAKPFPLIPERPLRTSGFGQLRYR